LRCIRAAAEVALWDSKEGPNMRPDH